MVAYENRGPPSKRRVGRTGYVELADVRLLHPGAENEHFVLLSRGWLGKGGVKKWERFVTIPEDADLMEWLARELAARAAAARREREASA